MLNGVLLIMATLLAFYLLFSSWLDLRLARRLDHIATAERTRGVWAEARALLLDLVVQGKLNPRSETFRTFYGLHTFVMRRPDAFNDFSLQVAKALIHGSRERKPGWVGEQKEWPREMVQVLERMSTGTEMLAFGHKPGRQYLIMFALRITPWLAMHLSRRASRRLIHLARKIAFVRAQRRLLLAYNQIESLRKSLASGSASHPATTPA